MAERPQQVVGDGDRVRCMRKWLLENREKVMRVRKGSLTFDFAGDKLTYHLREGPEEVKGKL